MNSWQMLLQIRHELRTVKWPSGSAAKVFNKRNVRVFAGLADGSALPASFPFVLLALEAGTADEDHPEFITQTFRILVASLVLGDTLGENALVGGPLPDLGKSAGHGVHELEERVRAAVGNLTGADGVKILLSTSSLGAPLAVGEGRHLVVSEMTVQGLCTSALAYAAPQELRVQGSTWTWEGDHVADRFDFRRYTLGYRAGTIPPGTIDDMDVVVYQGVPPTTVNHTPLGKTYAVIAEYGDGRKLTVTAGESPGAEVGAFLDKT